MDSGTTLSTANLAKDGWTVTNTEHGVVTVHRWLDTALAHHRSALANRTDQTVQIDVAKRFAREATETAHHPLTVSQHQDHLTKGSAHEQHSR